MSGSNKIPLSGGASLSQNPFAGLDAAGLRAAGEPGGKSVRKIQSPPTESAERNRGRVEILRTTAGRGGKTVTIVQAFVGIGLPEKEALAKKMQKRCGCGGTVKDGKIEIQGDQRDEIAKILTEAGFRPVFAGG